MSGFKANVGEALKTIGEFTIKGFKIVAPFIGYALLNSATKSLENMPYRGNCDYGDAVGAISSSTMSSWDKNSAISVLKKDGDAGFYKAVIETARSTMSSWDKLAAIKNLSKTE